MRASTFDHPALLYRTSDEYLAGTTGFVRAARADGDRVLVAVPGDHLTLLRAALAGEEAGVAFADISESGRNPGRIIPSVLLQFAAEHADTRVSIVGEPVWPGRSALEYPACATHEALINVAFAGRDATILCPYDTSCLDAAMVDDARRTHPVLIEHGNRMPNDRYEEPLRTAARYNVPLPPPPDGAATMPYATGADLADVRAFVRRQSAGVLSAARAAELMLAAHELAANTITHTGGGGRIAVWPEPGLMACQVDDTGHLADPMAGRVPPPARQPSGRGLLLVNQLCDLVRLHTRPGATSIRIHILCG
ncbi:sensor histidine kinase [Paractinoplanes rishiriensis]|uniref:Anti-sigma regulatory factor n=1 Tax=Paractinoplanes rishiriensis TaxID=1050105 RepID=A0A919K4E1_9ACTN|nr:sensor histidine kinase [Actinoplanes rishiriensis]GIF00697.1 anti-sigma regulatory factor [Actinoplanes rishiriensis]